jgi:Ca2+-binding RTX toxin-like protein
MASIVFSRALPGTTVLSSRVFIDTQDAPILATNPTSLVLSASDTRDDRLSFIGSGLSYVFVGGELMGVNAGTVTRILYNNPSLGQTYFDWTGLNVSAPTFVEYVMTSNWSALNTLLFNTSDTYDLTDGRDAVRGFGGNDVINGYGGADRLIGDDGNDKLSGGNGADVMEGGSGADTLIGGAGVDTYTGGAGADVFAFTSRAFANREIVTDFNGAVDELHFDNDAFTAFTYTGQLRSADFARGTEAADVTDRFIYQKSTGNLWYDADGSRAGGKVLVAELADGTALSAGDIFIL